MTSSTPQLLNRMRMRQVALMLAIEEHRTLRAAAQVAADVTYNTLIIESGAQIEGRFAKSKV